MRLTKSVIGKDLWNGVSAEYRGTALNKYGDVTDTFKFTIHQLIFVEGGGVITPSDVSDAVCSKTGCLYLRGKDGSVLEFSVDCVCPTDGKLVVYCLGYDYDSANISHYVSHTHFTCFINIYKDVCFINLNEIV